VIKYALPALMLIQATATFAETKPTPITRFDARFTATTTEGVPQPVRIRFISWGLTPRNKAIQEIPLAGFYVAHLRSGTISATTGGQTIVRQAGSFWTVGEGAKMQVRVLGEAAELETIVVTKPSNR
jgi:hypothetical protein